MVGNRIPGVVNEGGSAPAGKPPTVAHGPSWNNRNEFPNTGLQFPQLLDRLLNDSKNEGRGVFLGEDHDMPALRDTLAGLMPQMRRAGVTTLSVELRQETVDRILSAEYQPRDDIMRSYVALIAAARTNGIRVIGHETPTILEDNDAQTLEGMSRRDRYAAALIERNRAPGKMIVLGGASHSHRRVTEAVPSPRRNIEDIATRFRNAPGYRGLDVLLGIPSVDYQEAVSIGDIGKTLCSHGTVFNGECTNQQATHQVLLQGPDTGRPRRSTP